MEKGWKEEQVEGKVGKEGWEIDKLVADRGRERRPEGWLNEHRVAIGYGSLGLVSWNS